MTSKAERSAVELAQAYLDRLQAKDRDGILALLAEDFALEVPCNVSGTNDYSDSWHGLEAAADNYDATFRKIELLKYVDLEFTPGRDPDIAFAEGRGVMRMASGRPYNNVYIFRFDTRGGKIRRIREYANPVTAALAMEFPLPQELA
jgi:ketosteroid isomerase-like protein